MAYELGEFAVDADMWRQRLSRSYIKPYYYLNVNKCLWIFTKKNTDSLACAWKSVRCSRRLLQGADAAAHADGGAAGEGDPVFHAVGRDPDEIGAAADTRLEQAVPFVVLREREGDRETDERIAPDDLGLQRVHLSAPLAVRQESADAVFADDLGADGLAVRGTCTTVHSHEEVDEAVDPGGFEIRSEVESGSGASPKHIARVSFTVATGHGRTRDQTGQRVGLDQGAVARDRVGGGYRVRSVRRRGRDPTGEDVVGALTSTDFVLDCLGVVGDQAGVLVGVLRHRTDEVSLEICLPREPRIGLGLDGLVGDLGRRLRRDARPATAGAAAAEVGGLLQGHDFTDTVGAEDLPGALVDVAERVHLGVGDHERPLHVVDRASPGGVLAAIELRHERLGLGSPAAVGVGDVALVRGVGDREHEIGSGAVLVDAVGDDLGGAWVDALVGVVAVVLAGVPGRSRRRGADEGGVTVLVGVHEAGEARPVGRCRERDAADETGNAGEEKLTHDFFSVSGRGWMSTLVGVNWICSTGMSCSSAVEPRQGLQRCSPDRSERTPVRFVIVTNTRRVRPVQPCDSSGLIFAARQGGGVASKHQTASIHGS